MRLTNGLRAMGTGLLAFWAPLALLLMLFVTVRQHSLAADFIHEHRPAARAVLDGHSPYPRDLVHTLASSFGFVYPPLTAFLAAPIALLPHGVAASIATLLTIALVPTMLWALGVSDWRCYAAVVLWFPTLSAIETANLSLPLACGLALCWRWRQRSRLAGALLGVLVAAKLLLWPLVIWSAAVRRYRSTACALGAAAVAVIVPWAAIGFAGMRSYPHLLRVLSDYEGPRSHSLASLFMLLTGSWHLSEFLGFLVGFVVLGVAFFLGRAGHERTSFVVAVTAALCLTSVVWAHYLVFLAVVLGVTVRRFSGAWLIPLALWLWPLLPSSGSGQTVLVVVTIGATLAAAVRADRPKRAESESLAIGRSAAVQGLI
jgi:Glycosyltransferase family 87